MTITNEERIEGSNLIAKFIGLEPRWVEYPNPQINRWEIRDNWNTWVPMEYHSSWEWLFIVIDKVNGLGKEYNFYIFKTYLALSVEKGGKVYKDFSFAHSEYITKDQTGKEAAFKLLVKFIKWYNEHVLNTNLKPTI